MTRVLPAVAALVIVLIVVLLLRGGEDSDNTPDAVDVGALSAAADRAGHPIYWLGERGNAQYQLTEASSGRVYIRYLKDGAEAGDKNAELVTVGTYPAGEGVAALRRVAGETTGAVLGRTNDGALLLIDPSSPNNAHLAYPGADLQIEIYSPVAGQALRLASKGDVQPVP